MARIRVGIRVSISSGKERKNERAADSDSDRVAGIRVGIRVSISSGKERENERAADSDSDLAYRIE